MVYSTPTRLRLAYRLPAAQVVAIGILAQEEGALPHIAVYEPDHPRWTL